MITFWKFHYFDPKLIIIALRNFISVSKKVIYVIKMTTNILQVKYRKTFFDSRILNPKIKIKSGFSTRDKLIGVLEIVI